jgi:hypothetical protein
VKRSETLEIAQRRVKSYALLFALCEGACIEYVPLDSRIHIQHSREFLGRVSFMKLTLVDLPWRIPETFGGVGSTSRSARVRTLVAESKNIPISTTHGLLQLQGTSTAAHSCFSGAPMERVNAVRRSSGQNMVPTRTWRSLSLNARSGRQRSWLDER